MGNMSEKPEVRVFEDNSKMWSHTFETFKVKVYVPYSELPEKIMNYGYEAPYLLVFEEDELDEEAAKRFATEKGLADIAANYASSVVFVYPTCDGGWKNADVELYRELIANSKIHEYHEDGYAILINRFTKGCDGYAIRGAIFRAFLFGKGESAGYIAKNLLRTVNGEGLWGPADIIPAACILEGLNECPDIKRKDMPIVSIANSDEINEYIMEAVDDCYICPNEEYGVIFTEFLKDIMRWGWVGSLVDSADFDELEMIREVGIVNVNTSSDNLGDDANTSKHDIGYFAFYNNDLFDNGPVPLVMAFHGGGDSAMHIAMVSEWYRVAMNNNFLLVCVENHLNSTATEMMELLEHLCERYAIDRSRIYASGFSMGGQKTWDLYQEYPKVFAGLAPMDATFDVGNNIYDKPAPCEINRDVRVPIFYTGGEKTPLPELPFQAQKCIDRMKYVFEVNKVVKEYDVQLENKDNWENKIWGIDGDRTEQFYDDEKKGTLTLHYFDSEDNNCYSVFGSISGQGHDCRYHTCEYAWQFLSQFRRGADGELVKED